jgi:shikimate dehydrogenase
VKHQPGRLVLLGHPVAHSLSPRFQNAALAAAGIQLRYEAIDVDPPAFEATVASLRSQRTAGNVTVPFKERMYAACDLLTPLAERVGAVNVFWTDDQSRLVGDNSDVAGFDAAVLGLLGERPSGMTVGVLGAGGAAAAVLAAIEAWPGCSAHVYNRTPERARILCERFGPFAQPVDDIGVVAGAQLVVNATAVGLHDDAHPLDPMLIAPGSAVFDLVYRPGESAWTRAVRARGHAACDGLSMLIEQGAVAFERWFGFSPDRSVMWASVSATSGRGQ